MILVYIYIAALAVGGVMLLTTVLFGGDHDFDQDVDVEISAGVDHELEVGHDLDTDHELETGHDLAPGHPTLQHGPDWWLPFFSLRFWVFFSTFFGLTGLILRGLHLAGDVTTLGFALIMGLLTGGSAAYIIQWLKRSESGTVLGQQSFVGQEGRVSLPFNDQKKGKVRLIIAGQVRELIALNMEPDMLSNGDNVTILKCENDIAYVMLSSRLIDSDN